MKPDLRVQKTKERLYYSLIELMEQTPFYEIHIVDVLRHSGVSKNTFYRHYQSLYDLYYEMMDLTIHNFCQGLHTCLNHAHLNPSYGLIQQSLRYEKILAVALKVTSPNILIDLLQEHYKSVSESYTKKQLELLAPEYVPYFDETLYYGYGAITTLRAISYILERRDTNHDLLAKIIYSNSVLYEKISTLPLHKEI